MIIDIEFKDDEEFRCHPHANRIPRYYREKLFRIPITNQNPMFPSNPSDRHQSLTAFRDSTQIGITLFEADILEKGARYTYFEVLNVIKHNADIRGDALATSRIWVCWLVSNELPVSEWLRAKECSISFRIHIAILLGKIGFAQQLVTQAQSDGTKLNCEQVAEICLCLTNFRVLASKELFLTLKNWLNGAADFTSDLERIESCKNSVVKLEANSNLLDDINWIVHYYEKYDLYILNYSDPNSSTERPQIEIKLDSLYNQVRALSLHAARLHDYLSINVLTTHVLYLIEVGDIIHCAFAAGDATLFAKMIVNQLLNNSAVGLAYFEQNHFFVPLLRKLKDQKLEKGIDWYLWLLELLPNDHHLVGDEFKKSIQLILAQARSSAVLEFRDNDDDDDNNANVEIPHRYSKDSSLTLFSHPLTSLREATVQPTGQTAAPNQLHVSLLSIPLFK